MNRREFLKKLGIGAAAVAMPVTVLGAIKPELEGEIFHLPVSVKPVMTATKIKEQTENYTKGNKLLTIDEITREALQILEKSMLKLG